MEIGLVCTLAVLLFAFEWKSYKSIDVELVSRTATVVEEEVIIQTDQSLPPPPPPPAAISTEIEIVEDTKVITNEVEINVESDEKTIVQEYVAPVVVEEVVVEEEIFQIVEEMPSYPGGDEARMAYLSQNLKYPVLAMESGIQGTVYIGFVVEKDGGVTDVRVARGIGGGCDEEAVRVVKAMPKWKAGKQRGRSVRVRYSVPIRFSLGN
ncbi:MAG: energy transducer TonB [Bacteroidales bacterium]